MPADASRSAVPAAAAAEPVAAEALPHDERTLLAMAIDDHGPEILLKGFFAQRELGLKREHAEQRRSLRAEQDRLCSAPGVVAKPKAKATLKKKQEEAPPAG